MFKTGHIAGGLDGTEPLYRDHPDLAGAAVLPSDDVDLRPDMPPVHDQLAQDCVDHAIATLAWHVARTFGVPLPFKNEEEPSVLHLYAVGRLRASPMRPLVDLGSNLKHTFEGVKHEGLVAESSWPELPENIDVVPPDDVWRRAEGVTISAYHKLADGSQSSAEIRAGLRRKRPSTICLLVDEAFAESGSKVYMTPGGKVYGSHCMLTVGYVRKLRAFIVRNSWGLQVGEAGYHYVHEDVVDRLSYEKLTFDLGPVIVESR